MMYAENAEDALISERMKFNDATWVKRNESRRNLGSEMKYWPCCIGMDVDEETKICKVCGHDHDPDPEKVIEQWRVDTRSMYGIK